MTNAKQMRIAKELLEVFLTVWCEKAETDKESWFNCKRCAFETKEGFCLVKTFLKAENGEILPKFTMDFETIESWGEVWLKEGE